MKISDAVKTIIIFGAGLAVGLIVSSFILQENTTSPTQNFEQKEGISASLMVDFQDGNIIVCGNQLLAEKRTVFNLLENCSKDTENPFELEYEVHPEWGVFIKSIGDKENGESGKYWQYWVNNEYAQVGVSQYQLQDGDIVEWKFFGSQE